MGRDTHPELLIDTPQLAVQAGPQGRVLAVLATAQVLAGVAVATGAAVATLGVAAVSGSAGIGGAAATAMVLGTAMASLLIARVANRAGRRPALALGYALGAVGAIGAATGVALGSWPLMLVAFLPFGAGNAAGLAARFAATDLAAPDRRARALGAVVWATTVGAIAGPNLAGPAESAAHALRFTPATGPLLLSAAAFGLAMAVIATGLRPDPLLLARGRIGARPDRADAGETALWDALWVAPRARLAVSGIALGQLVMVGLMSMTPVHMNHGGASLTLVGLVISTHLAGMYALAPVFGWLTDRAGPLPVLGTGMLLLVVSGTTVAAADGHQAGLLAAGLGVLGLGWSAGLVAGSALVTDAVPARHRTAAQGLTDAAMNFSGAAGGIAAGLTVAATSFGVLALATAGLVAPMLGVVLVMNRVRSHRASTGFPPVRNRDQRLWRGRERSHIMTTATTPSTTPALQLGDEAPDFTAETTEGTLRFHEWLGDSWGVLFSHPKDFTPVCTTELGEVARIRAEFDRRGVKVIGLSVDPLDAHRRWAADIEETQGHAPNFPMIADADRAVAHRYGMIHPNADDTTTVRSVFVIGPDKKVKLMITYPQSTGRNFDEVLRVIDSLQLTASYKVSTPVNWRQGEDVIIVPAVSDDEAAQRFPHGWKTVKPYLRIVPQPR
jgi:alkyl hydroperoxide reductase subunit AhpC/MFS family permease